MCSAHKNNYVHWWPSESHSYQSLLKRKGHYTAKLSFSYKNEKIKIALFPHLYATHVHPHWWVGAIPFLLSNNVVVKYKSSICLICRWSQLDLVSYHSWICFTKILQRSELLSDISHSILSVEGMMSGTANKVCVKSLNKAWNWRDACLSEAPWSHRQQTGTAAHLQTARLPFGLPLKCPALWVNTFNAENDFIHFPL